MDIKQLKYFRTIVEEGTISAAAQRLFMAQPSLSQQLKLLENELAVTLIERGGRRIRLTEAGRLLNDRSGQILDLLQTAVTELKEMQEGYVGTLTIGTIASAGVTLLPGWIHAFHEKYPRVQIQLREGDTHTILELLRNGIVEVGIVRAVFALEQYHSKKLPPEPMIVAMSAQWEAQMTDAAISIAQLAGMPLLLHRSNESLIREAAQSVGFSPQIVCLGDDVRSLLVLANEGLGLAIVPKSALGLVPSHQMAYKEIVDSPLKIEKAVVWSRDRRLSVAAKHFLDNLLTRNLQVDEVLL